MRKPNSCIIKSQQQNSNNIKQINRSLKKQNLLNKMSRHNAAYMSTSNMSDIKQSIEEYSMNYQNSQQAISQMISVSKTGNASISRNSKQPVKKSFVKIVDQEQNKHHIKKTQQSVIEQQPGDKQNHSFMKQNENKNNQPVFLGDNVFKYVKEKFHEVQGTQTSNPDVLYQFFKRQKKINQQNRSTIKNITLNDVGVLMPSSQRKMLLKMQFQKILTYYPHDVYYTLCCGAQKLKKDQQISNKINRLDNQLMKRPQSQKKNIKQVVDRLYVVKRSQSLHKTSQIYKQNPSQIDKQRQERQKRRIFGNRLRQVYQNNFKNNPKPPVQSAQKLWEFWQDMYQRDQYGIQWNQDTVKQDIRIYMMEQIQDLIAYLQRKLGFKQMKGQDLKKFYAKHYPIEGINIPLASFKQYAKIFNQIMQQRDKKRSQQFKKKVFQEQKKIKERQLKKFGRPVSATPISVLSKPKTSTANFGQIVDKYSNDRYLSTILHADKMKMARHAFEYGIHNLEEQVKTKGRVKPKQKQQFQKTIFKLLNNTFTNKNFFNIKDVDRVRDIIGQEDIQKQQNWKQISPVLQQAMLVKCYEQTWFRQTLLRYCKKIITKDLKFDDDKTVVQQVIKYLNNLAQDDRKDQVSNLDNLINTSQTIAERTQQIKKLSQKGQNVEIKQKKLFYSYLQQKACQFVSLRIKRQQINLRKFLNEIFEKSLKDYKQFVTKHFHVVTGQKQCPKLLKYQFFRLQKQINPFTKQRDQVAKCHAWIPTKNGPESFNYKTFNSYSNAYKKDKNKIISGPEAQNHKNSIWGYKKERVKDRQILLMSYDDAKQCTFHPKISKNNM